MASCHFFLLCLCISISRSCGGIQLILVNNCNESIWPAVLGGAGQPTPEEGGFHLGASEEAVFDVPSRWSGRIWGRQGCCFDDRGKGSCDTGDCGGQLHCGGAGGEPPATVVEMTLGTAKSGLHYYDVSLVDGFNLPVAMAPVGGGVGCGVALKADQYCCTGEYGSPKSCKPTLFSNLFKSICPRAYSFAFDDSSSLRTCRASRYLITFCPPNR